MLCLGASGCYLGHVAAGQAELLWKRRPIDLVLSDPMTPPALRDRLEWVEHARRYATELGLRVGQRYTSYVPWPGDRLVTTVVATRRGQVEPAGFWFPIVGRVPYKGYFDVARAESEARRLRGRDMDVCVVPVVAYSTLGWFDDPVTGPMLRQSEGDLSETLFHELVHATVFVAGRADFDEGVASFIGEEARVRFAKREHGAAAAARERERVGEERRVHAELERARHRVEALYAARPAGPERDAARAEITRDTRARIAALHLADRDAAALAERIPLGDACLALAGTYEADTDRYATVLDAMGGDLAAFVTRAVEASRAPDPSAALTASR